MEKKKIKEKGERKRTVARWIIKRALKWYLNYTHDRRTEETIVINHEKKNRILRGNYSCPLFDKICC